MSDYSELKRLAEAAKASCLDSGQRWPEADDWFEPELCSDEMAFVKGANPVAILALIAENDKLTAILAHQKSRRANDEECLALASQSIDELRKDAERYRWLRQYTVDSYLAHGSFESLDRDIDAAMGNGEQP